MVVAQLIYTPISVQRLEMSKSGTREELGGHYNSPRRKDGGLNCGNTILRETVEGRRHMNRLLKMKRGSS